MNGIRLERLVLRNFKNVSNGEIFFNEYKSLSRGVFDEEIFSNILGIYGQNGSGKTSAINALKVIQYLLSGKPLPEKCLNYVKVGYNSFEIFSDFLITFDELKLFVKYSVKLGKDENRYFILEENLSSYNVIDKKDSETGFSFKKGKKISGKSVSNFSKDIKVIYDYIADIESDLDKNDGKVLSTIFNKKLIDLVSKEETGNELYIKIIQELEAFAVKKCLIYNMDYFKENEDSGIKFRITNEEGNIEDVIASFDQSVFSYSTFKAFKNTIDGINKVMPAIIPNYKIDIISSNSEDVQKITNKASFILVAKRKDEFPVPLIDESNGIKKIISLISGLLETFNNEGVLMAVDELDSGVFEYLLGELVYTFANFSKGQLIFTSHNLRALEKLNYKNIFFTTTNENKTYTQLINVRPSNNLRDLYYKCIANENFKTEDNFYDLISTEDLVAALASEEEEDWARKCVSS